MAAHVVPPSMLYVNPEPSPGTVTSIVPVEIAQVGCMVTLAVGAAGATGTGLTVNDVATETQVGFLLSRTVME